MQAQEYALAKWSIGQRARDMLDGDVDAALEAGTIVRTHVMRPTWHFVAAEDVRWLLGLTGSRVHQKNARRYRELGLDAKILARCERVIATALANEGRLTRKGIAEVLGRGRVDIEAQRLPYILMHCELEALIGSGGMEGKQHTYALLDEKVPPGHRLSSEAALTEIVRRYLQSHGPATAKDIGWWSGLTLGDVRRGVEGVTDAEESTVDGTTFWSLGGPSPPRPRGSLLLQVYDETVVGYSDSRFFGDPRAEEARAAWKDRSLPQGIVLVDGAIAGHWRRTLTNTRVKVEIVTYGEPRRTVTRKVESATAELGAFFGHAVESVVEMQR